MAYKVIESLDHPPNPMTDEEWDAEIDRRLREAQEGRAVMISGDEVRRRLEARLHE